MRHAFFLILLLGAWLGAADQPAADPQPVEVTAGVPAGAGWTKLLVNGSSSAGWVGEPGIWRVEGDVFTGEVVNASNLHHHAYTEAEYSDFELTCETRLVSGKDPNSGICIRMLPEFHPGVGYQVDTGAGYWGCLYEVGSRNKKVAPVSKELELKLVKQGDWNAFYVRAVGHHIQLWLNGTKTVDIDDQPGRLTGRIGFQLAHSRVMAASFRNLYIRPIEVQPKP